LTGVIPAVSLENTGPAVYHPSGFTNTVLDMSAKLDRIPSLPSYEKGQLVRVRPLLCNPKKGQAGVVMQVRPDARGTRVLDKYVVQFTDNDEEEFWGIQLEAELSRFTGPNSTS
jgi:hypothetical protein